jgi:hypothetical protein
LCPRSSRVGPSTAPMYPSEPVTNTFMPLCLLAGGYFRRCGGF